MRHCYGARRSLCVVLLVSGCLLAGCVGGGGTGGGSTDRSGVTPRKPGAGKPAEHPRPGDFNGDGYDDFVTVVTSRSKDGGEVAENLVVVHGSPDGLDPATARRTPAGGKDAYFTSVLRADLDGDGFTDLVAGRGRGDTRLETRPPSVTSTATGGRTWSSTPLISGATTAR